MECYNCGLPDAAFQAKIKFKAKTAFRGASTRTLNFCSAECSRQTSFLQLETRSTPESVTRFLAGKPIRYSEYREIVPLVDAALSEGSTPLTKKRRAVIVGK